MSTKRGGVIAAVGFAAFNAAIGLRDWLTDPVAGLLARAALAIAILGLGMAGYAYSRRSGAELLPRGIWSSGPAPPDTGPPGQPTARRIWFPRGWYRSSGSLWATVAGLAGMATLMGAFLWHEDLPLVVVWLLSGSGLALFFAGTALSVYDTVRPFVPDDPERRAWVARHGDPDLRDDPADRPERRD